MQSVENHGIWLALGAVVLAVLLLAGCDARRIEQLEEGVSTETDVRKAMGEPERVWPEPDGARTFEYNRQPTGHRNYMITLAPDGVMRSLRQVLTPENMATAAPGLEEEVLRRRFGKPARIVPYALSGETDWVWHYLEDGNRSYSFTATLGRDGRLLRTSRTPDPTNDAPDTR